MEELLREVTSFSKRKSFSPQRQFVTSLSGCYKDGVGQGRSYRWNTGLTGAAHLRNAIHDVYFNPR